MPDKSESEVGKYLRLSAKIAADEHDAECNCDACDWVLFFEIEHNMRTGEVEL